MQIFSRTLPLINSLHSDLYLSLVLSYPFCDRKKHKFQVTSWVPAWTWFKLSKENRKRSCNFCFANCSIRTTYQWVGLTKINWMCSSFDLLKGAAKPWTNMNLYTSYTFVLLRWNSLGKYSTMCYKVVLPCWQLKFPTSLTPNKPQDLLKESMISYYAYFVNQTLDPLYCIWLILCYCLS